MQSACNQHAISTSSPIHSGLVPGDESDENCSTSGALWNFASDGAASRMVRTCMQSVCIQYEFSMQSACNLGRRRVQDVRTCVWSQRQPESTCTQHALSMHSARNQHAISMQSSYLHVAPTAEHLARVAPRHRAEEPCAACGIVVAPDPAEIERCPTSLLCRTLRLPLRGRMHAELTHLWEEGGAPW